MFESWDFWNTPTDGGLDWEASDAMAPTFDTSLEDAYPDASAGGDALGTGWEYTADPDVDQEALGRAIVADTSGQYQEQLGREIVAGTEQEVLGRQIVAQSSNDWWASAGKQLAGLLPALFTAGQEARGPVAGASSGQPASVRPVNYESNVKATSELVGQVSTLALYGAGGFLAYKLAAKVL
jgi:hypothetical protein